jgi:hypothetical protein
MPLAKLNYCSEVHHIFDLFKGVELARDVVSGLAFQDI